MTSVGCQYGILSFRRGTGKYKRSSPTKGVMKNGYSLRQRHVMTNEADSTQKKEMIVEPQPIKVQPVTVIESPVIPEQTTPSTKNRRPTTRTTPNHSGEF